MKMWTKKDRDYLVFRTEVEIDLPLEVVAYYVQNEEFMKKIDTNGKDLNILCQESSQ